MTSVRSDGTHVYTLVTVWYFEFCINVYLDNKNMPSPEDECNCDREMTNLTSMEFVIIGSKIVL
jgi:hypothetical protein